MKLSSLWSPEYMCRHGNFFAHKELLSQSGIVCLLTCYILINSTNGAVNVEERRALLQLRDSLNHPNGSALVNEWVGDDYCAWDGILWGHNRDGDGDVHVADIFLTSKRELGLGIWYPDATLLSSFGNLKSLYLSGNFVGSWVMPEALCRLSNLKVLDLSSNPLNGDIIPHFQACSLSSLEELHLSSIYPISRPASSVLTALCGLKNLHALDLSNNRINDGNAPPCLLRNLYSLETLDLSGNELWSSPLILTDLCSLRDLRKLDLSHNFLDDGSFPSCLFHNQSSLESLDISLNNLKGSSNIFSENFVKFVNAGGGAIKEEGDLRMLVMPDHGFDGGNVLRTSESIVDDGIFEVLYQSARIGNFTYQFDSLPAGVYLVDLHFAEIINTDGPKGMRVFDVFIQEDKVLSELDIYSMVGANKPLRLEDVRVTVGANGVILIRFQGLSGSPIVSGICINETPKLLASHLEQRHSESARFSLENKDVGARSNARFQRKIQELQAQCRQKTDECYQAWMSLTDMNKKLEDVRMELDNKCFQNHCLDQDVVLLSEKLKNISRKYEYEKRLWLGAINDLELKVKIMKDEQNKLSQEAHDCANLIPDLNKMVSAVQGLVSQFEDLKLKCSEEQAERKKLYNQIQETKGNIRVFCRCRPLSREEALVGYATVVDFDAAKDGDIGILPSGSTKKTYKFDRVYTAKSDQADVFADAAPLVISVLDGYNVCILAYGQTGTGKTFTMEGTEHNRGVNYRTLDLLFRMVEERKETFSYNISVNVLEVYNDQIRDLLANSPPSKKLEIRQVSEGANHVPGLVNAEVDNIRDVWKFLQAGSTARAVGSNNVNEHSSRSHCMICIRVTANNSMNGECTKSKLWLVDLAGSERLAKTDVQGERLKEAQNINRSVSALGDVISALASKSTHIPYRNSKLTHLLQDSLGGNSKTLMFVQISPLEQDLCETLSSLNFATRVKGVELGPAKKQIDVGELQKLKLMLDKSKQESRSKNEALQKLEENICILESKAKGKEQFCKSQQEKANELENQLVVKADLCRQMDRQLTELSMQMRVGEDIRANLQQKVNNLEKRLIDRDHVESNQLQHKVKQLEKTLKERTEEFEVQSAVLQKKVKELEQKLEKRGGSNSKESLLHHQKIQELEEKLNQREKQLEISPPLCALENLRDSPNDDGVNTDPRCLGLKADNQLTGQGSVLLKGSESLRQLRVKRDYKKRGVENNYICLSADRLLPTESNKGRHIDPSKAFARVTRTTKPFSGLQRSFSTRISREPVPMIKDQDISTRVWLR